MSAVFTTAPNIARGVRPPRTRYHFLRDAIVLLCGGKVPPLKMVEAYYGSDDNSLQWWCFNNRGCDWMTGIGIVEAAEALVEESIINGNLLKLRCSRA